MLQSQQMRGRGSLATPDYDRSIEARPSVVIKDKAEICKRAYESLGSEIQVKLL